MFEPFYKDGLNFECQRCSGCCRYDSGYVFLSEEDISNLLEVLGISREELLEKYCTEVNISGTYRISLQEKENFDCIFWIDGGCSVYKGRPLQCRSFPFWAPYLESREDWDGLGESCPGVNKGKLHSREEIEEWLYRRRAEKLISVKPDLKEVLDS